MKKVILIVSIFFLTSSFSDKKEVNETNELERFGCVEVKLSCGPTGPVCGATFADFIRNVMWAENHFCGQE